jgi:hypothetical protein
MDHQIWSVGLVVDDAEARHLSEDPVALYMMRAGEGHFLGFSPPRLDDEGFETLRLEVTAGSGGEAESRALNIIYAARRGAKLPDRIVPVAWIAPLNSDQSGKSYLDQAEDLVIEKQFGLAIVAAEIHLESQTRKIIELAVRRSAPTLESVLLQHRNNVRMSHPAGRNMIERFLDLAVTKLPEWEAYLAHLGRRNAVVHSGRSFEEPEAADSVGVVRKIWLRLTEAARQVEKHAEVER